jgi:hypothetical protein
MGFLNYTLEYDWVLRIDADCTVLSSNMALPFPDHVHVASPAWLRADVYRTREVEGKAQIWPMRGMANFTLDYFRDNNMKETPQLLYGRPDTKYSELSWYSPYTNVVYFNLKWLRAETQLAKFMSKVDASGCIYQGRWGDLELWGMNLVVAQEDTYYLMNLSYHHNSHHCVISNNDGHHKHTCGAGMMSATHVPKMSASGVKLNFVLV